MTGKRDTIVAVASGTGGAIALIRLSGPTAIAIGDRIFTGVSGSPLSRSKGFTVHFGHIRNEADEIIDDVLVSLFAPPAPIPVRTCSKSPATVRPSSNKRFYVFASGKEPAWRREGNSHSKPF